MCMIPKPTGNFSAFFFLPSGILIIRIFLLLDPTVCKLAFFQLTVEKFRSDWVSSDLSKTLVGFHISSPNCSSLRRTHHGAHPLYLRSFSIHIQCIYYLGRTSELDLFGSHCEVHGTNSPFRGSQGKILPVTIDRLN